MNSNEQIDSKILEARKKLQNKFKSQIGGKGSVRRKKKITHSRLNDSRIKTKEELKLENTIININKQIKDIEDKDTHDLAMIYLEDTIFFHLQGVDRHDVNKKDFFKLIKKEPSEFFNSNFLVQHENYNQDNSDNQNENENEQPSFLFKEQNLNTFREYFSRDGIYYILSLFTEIDKILETKQYLEVEEQQEELSVSDCFQILDLDETEIPTKKQLILAYRKKALEMHPDKHPDETEKYEDLFKTLNKSYKFLLSRYNLK
tara:strand:+ start:1333 stop:2112 length:780 start_codon:yes stop_codon:yes gene_type:complete